MEPSLCNKKAPIEMSAELICFVWCFGARLYRLLIPMSLVQLVL